MSRSFSMPTPQLIRRGVSLNGNFAHRMILTVLLTALATLPFWLGLEWVHSAPAESAGPPLARPGPPPGPTPSVTLDVPDEVLIGDTFKFKMTFTPGNVVGFGPFVDLVIPSGGANYTAATGPCDGITFISAEMIGVNGGPVPLTTFPAAAPPCTTNPTPPVCETLPHPFAASGISTILVPPGSQLFTIKLPFGSFQANQPPITIQVTASISSLANVNVPLNIYARAGYQFGGDASNNFATDPPVLSPGGVTDCTTWDASAPVTPVLFTFKVEDPLTNSGPCYDGIDNGSDNLTDSKDPDCKHAKTYIGPEDETATGPNYPRQYKIILNIADGQTVNTLTIQDCLPNNVVFTGIGIGTAPTPVPVPLAQTAPLNNNCLSFNYATIVGTSSTTDIVIFVKFYVPQTDANGDQVLDPATCSNATSPNDVKASGNWTPTDPRDAAITVTSDMATVDHLLTDKRIAIQKSVETYPVPNAPLIPGGVLKYTLSFQVSDFFTVGNIVLTDILSDAQDLITSPSAPKLIVTDRRGPNPTVVPFSSGLNFLNVPNPFVDCGGVHGGRSLVFQVSTAMQNNSALFTDPVLQQGILTGGWAFTPTSSTPATGQIEFYVVVRDKFIHSQPTGDQFVDKDDPINNCVTVSADIYTNHPTLPVPKTPQLRCLDDSATALSIVTDTLKKSVYAIKRGGSFVCGPSSINGACPLPPAAPEVRPGDQVTFRIEKTIPSGDAEDVIVEDWLPQPIFNVGSTGFQNIPCVGVPLAGNACLGPNHQLHLAPILAAPTFNAITATNSLSFTYADFNYTANLPRKIDLLFTHAVTHQPFADGLQMTNEVRECEKNTFGKIFCQAAIAQVTLREPNLRVRKGVIATNNPNGQFSQPGPPPTANLATAQAPPNATLSLAGISGPAPMVTSNDLATGVLDSNILGGVDANDIVTFAITIENQGGHPAYDAKLEEKLPACFTNLSNIVVKRGTSAVVNPLLYTLATTANGFTITSIPGAPINAYHPTNGANIVVITFQAKLRADVSPGCCDNVAELQQYASKPGGLNFVTAGFTPPFTDTATVCVKPVLTKSLVTTSEAHTLGSDVTIGEIVRYRLVVQLPETGLLTNFQVTDALPAGLKFRNDGTARIAFVSNGPGIFHPSFGPPFGPPFNVVGNQGTLPGLTLSASQTITTGITVGSSCGDDPVFNLGNIKNNNSDNDLEYIVIEFNALVCNEGSNQNGTPLSNTFSVSVGGTQIATSNPINVIIVEPNFTMTKTVAPNPAFKGQTLTYTVQYTNNGSADAFNVELKDTLPAGLTFGTITAGCPFTNVPANTLTVTCAQIPKAPNPGSTVIITYQAVANPATCPVKLNNQANLTWTSLPGLQGTLVNPTDSSTPGNSGAGDGERDGVTPLLTLNDYATTASVAVKIDCPCEAMITGLKFHDLNGNGIRDTGEPGLANWTIQVTDSSGITHTTTTDSQGNYSFTVPAPGTYTVAEVLQSGWTQTAPTTGTYSVTVSPGQVVNNLSFGNWKKQKGCDLEIKKEVRPSPLVSGQQATATITVKNVGASPCHGPTHVAESMPAGLTLVSASVPGGNCVVATGICTYPPAILPGASIVFTYVFNVTAQPGTKFENCAKLKTSEDKNPANNGTCVPLTVSDVKLPDLTIKKIVQCGGPAIPPGTCSVTFTISNNGPGAFNGILVIKDLVTPTPSPGLGWAGSSTPPGWSCGIGGPDSVGCATTSSVSLVPGQSTSFSILLKVPVGQFQNCASVKGYTQFPYNASTLIQEGDFNNNESCVSMGGSSSGDCATPPPGMVAWWPLDETAGATTVTDIIGANNGTPQPGPIGPSNSGPLPGISSGVTPPAMVGGSLYFYSQANRFVRVPNTSAPSLNFGAGDFTVDAWVYPVQVGQTVVQPIVDKLQLVSSPAGGIGYRLFILNGKLQFVLLDGLTAVNTQAPITAGQWQHVAVVRSGGTPNTVKVYIGGQLISTSTPVVGNISNNADLLIGGVANSPGTGGLPSGFGYGEIAIDEVEIFKTALAQSDIVRIYRAGSAGKCKSLATIKGKKFNDLNKSKVLEPGEPGLSGWTIQVQDRGSNTKSTTTDAQGNYYFTVPAPGTYTLSEVNQEGWSPTTRERTVTLASNQSAEVNFGNISVRRRDPFTLERGMNEFCFWGSGGPYNSPRPIDNPNLGFTNNPNSTLVGNTGGSRFGAIGLCYGRILYANDTIAFKYTFNATPVAVLSYPDVNPVFVDRGFPVPVSYTRRNVFGSGLSPIGLQLYFRPQSRIKPFVSTSAGFLFFKEPIPRLNGTRLHFASDFGGGVQVFRDSRRAFTFGYKYQRLFGGSGTLNNRGLNGNVFSFGYSIFK